LEDLRAPLRPGLEPVAAVPEIVTVFVLASELHEDVFDLPFAAPRDLNTVNLVSAYLD